MPPKKAHVHLTAKEKQELRKQKKLERKLRKAEEKRQLQRNYLSREVKYGELNYKKYEKNWKSLLIKASLPRMRNDLEFAWHNFERVIDCKDFTISLLMDELREAEEQYIRNFQTHSQNIENLLEMFNKRLTELRKDFNYEIELMLENCETEKDSINTEYQDNFDYLKTMLYQLELQKKEHIRLKRGDYFSRLDEIDVKNQLNLQKLKATLETKYQTMFDGIKNFIKTYNKRIQNRKKEYHALKTQEDALQELITQQFNHMQKLQNTIRILKQKYIDLRQTEGSTFLDLQEERRYFSNSFVTLKANLACDKLDDFKKLASLTENSDQIFVQLKQINLKGEKILSLAGVCRKLETQKEKVIPFPLLRTSLQKANEQDDDDKNIYVKPEMELFWQRMGQAFSVHFALSREKRCLCEENNILINTHNEYCEFLTYPPIIKKRGDTIPKSDGNFEMKKYMNN